MTEIIFICGVNGVGKSTTIPHLRALLSHKRYSVHDFDERGVPENASSIWRISETNYWLEKAKASAQKEVVTIVCGFIKPTDLGDNRKYIGSTIQCILLDANPQTIRTRLQGRYTKNGTYDPDQVVIGKSIEEFIAGNIYIRETLKTEFQNLGCTILETDIASPAQIAKNIVNIMQSFS